MIKLGKEIRTTNERIAELDIEIAESEIRLAEAEKDLNDFIDNTKPDCVISVYDNNDETFDRYTIVTNFDSGSRYATMLGLSSNPTDPQGFSQWGEGIDGEHLGTKIEWHDLPMNIRYHIKERVS